MENEISELLARVHPRLKRILCRYRIPVADAEDLVQDACLTLVRSWETIESPEAWLAGTLNLLCLRYRLGMTPAEISALLGYPSGSIRKLSSRALARMRRAYG